MAEPDSILTNSTDPQADEQSSRWSNRSRRSFTSSLTGSFSYSSGQRSLEGATWRQDLVLTMNSGFGLGSRRIGDNKEVREGRERGGLLPRIRGVGRLGRGPIAVPASMLRALGVKSVGSGLEIVDETGDEEMYDSKQTGVDLTMSQLKAIKEEVEQICRIPEEDEMYVYKLAAEGGSDQHTMAMAESIMERVAELHPYLDDKLLETESTTRVYISQFTTIDNSGGSSVFV